MTEPEIVKKVAWMPVKDRKVLFARSRKEPVLFYCTGGKVDKKEDGSMETELETLAREVMEEAGVTLDPATVRHVHTFVGPCHGYPEGTLLHMICYDGVPDKEPVASSEIAELAYFNSNDKYRTTELGKEILEWFRDQGSID
jgi:8-oxo-dGTP pyrophosphatase MutT (NUDIX family)